MDGDCDTLFLPQGLDRIQASMNIMSLMVRYKIYDIDEFATYGQSEFEPEDNVA